LRFFVVVITLGQLPQAARAECADPKLALGVSRTVEIDASKGGIYGSVTRQTKEPPFLLDRQNGGIILFHGIKAVTARALPEILAGLKARGYGVVQIKAKEPVHLLPEVVAALAADKNVTQKRTGLLPFYSAVEPDRSAWTAALRGYSNKTSANRHVKPAEAARRMHRSGHSSPRAVDQRRFIESG
jgi:hypothetical protein